MTSVLALDPGEMAGWARGRIEDGALRVDAFGYDPWKVLSLAVYHRMTGPEPYDVVVYEAWRLQKAKALSLVGSDMQSSQCIGCIKLSCWLAGQNGNAVTLVNQEPAIKNVIDSMKGGTDYLPERQEVEHYRDALRHLHYYAVNKGGCKP